MALAIHLQLLGLFVFYTLYGYNIKDNNDSHNEFPADVLRDTEITAGSTLENRNCRLPIGSCRPGQIKPLHLLNMSRTPQTERLENYSES